MQNIQKKTLAKEKNMYSIHKLLHKILKSLQTIYAIGKILKAIKKLFS